MITDQEYKDALAEREKAEAVILKYGQQKSDDFKARWQRFEHGEHFTDADLIYSAGARCSKCQAGLAYPKGCDPWHQWTCSNVLKGIGEDKGHEAFPFSFYEIKSEEQPSARGATTRPFDSTKAA